MKLLFKPFKILLGFIISILIIPLIILFLLWRPVTAPTYEDSEINLESAITESIDDFMETDTENRKPLNVSLNENTINNEIKKQLLDQLEASETSDEYVLEEGPVLIQGVWVKLKENTIEITLGIHVDTSVLIFKSRVLLAFEIIDTEGVINLKLTKLTVGKLPLAWASGVANWLVKSVMKTDIEKLVQDQLGDIGEFNLKDRTLTIDLRKIMPEENEQSALINTLIDVLYAEELIELGVKETNDEFAVGIFLGLNKLENTKPAISIPINEKINNETELELFLATKINIDETKLIQTLLNTNPEFKLSALDLNIVLDYFVGQSLPIDSNNLIQKLNIYEDYSINLRVPYIEITNGNLGINIPLELVNEVTTDKFLTTIELSANIEVLNNDLMFNISGVTIGELNIDNELIEQLLTLFPEDVDFISETSFVLKDFGNHFDQVGLTIKDINFENDDLVISYEIEGLNNALEDVLNNPIINADIKDKIETVLDDLENEGNINDLLDAIEDLTEEEKADLFNALENALGNLIP